MIKYQVSTLKGIVLSVSRYAESSAVITLATEKGLFSLIARGVYKAKSPLKPVLIVGNVVLLDIKEKGSGPSLISSAKTVFDASIFYGNQQDISFLFVLEQLSRVLFSQGDSYPLDEVIEILLGLKDDGDVLSLTLLLVGAFYRNLGYNQNVNSCIRCNNSKNIVAFDLDAGGFICNNCVQDEQVRSAEQLQVIKYAFSTIDEKNLKRKVPKITGKLICLGLVNYLLNIFDLDKCSSLDNLLALID